jgi:hypothetical protein
LLVFVFLTACKRQSSTPELQDPIYADLVRKTEASQRAVEEAKRELEEVKKDFQNAGIQNGEIKVLRQAVFDKTQQLDNAAQSARLLAMQTESRKNFARNAYKKAFDADKEWPDPEEFRLYKIHQKLVDIPKSYDETHQNRLKERKPASKTAKKEAAAAPAH